MKNCDTDLPLYSYVYQLLYTAVQQQYSSSIQAGSTTRSLLSVHIILNYRGQRRCSLDRLRPDKSLEMSTPYHTLCRKSETGRISQSWLERNLFTRIHATVNARLKATRKKLVSSQNSRTPILVQSLLLRCISITMFASAALQAGASLCVLAYEPLRPRYLMTTPT